MYHSADNAAICIGFSLSVDYNAKSEALKVRQEIPIGFRRLVYPKVHNLGAKHGIKAVRSLKAVLAPQKCCRLKRKAAVKIISYGPPRDKALFSLPASKFWRFK